jgi:hypothetical protein
VHLVARRDPAAWRVDLEHDRRDALVLRRLPEGVGEPLGGDRGLGARNGAVGGGDGANHGHDGYLVRTLTRDVLLLVGRGRRARACGVHRQDGHDEADGQDQQPESNQPADHERPPAAPPPSPCAAVLRLRTLIALWLQELRLS